MRGREFPIESSQPARSRVLRVRFGLGPAPPKFSDLGGRGSVRIELRERNVVEGVIDSPETPGDGSSETYSATNTVHIRDGLLHGTGV